MILGQPSSSTTSAACSVNDMDIMYNDVEAQRSSESSPLISKNSLTPVTSQSSTFLDSIPATTQTIRFQVVLWHVDHLDVVNQQIAVTFRVAIFWNDNAELNDGLLELRSDSSRCACSAVWQMHGRQKAFLHEYPHSPLHAVEVPPLSIVNAINFATIGSPEVSMIRDSDKLMRWTCMYRATLIQDHWRVDDFPHDEHDIQIKLAILSHRGPGAHWDRTIWRLGLATVGDTDGSTRIPHGLVVDHVSVPEFIYSKSEGLSFNFVPLDHGQPDRCSQDHCLVVKLRVWRDSNYYDKNIVPLLAVIHFVATSLLFLEAELFFFRGLLTLNMAFVGMGLRISTDRNLPSSSYQIKIQRIFNEYFFGTLALVLESLTVYMLHKYGFTFTGYIDVLAGLLALTQNVTILLAYYAAAERLHSRALKDL